MLAHIAHGSLVARHAIRYQYIRHSFAVVSQSVICEAPDTCIKCENPLALEPPVWSLPKLWSIRIETLLSGAKTVHSVGTIYHLLGGWCLLIATMSQQALLLWTNHHVAAAAACTLLQIDTTARFWDANPGDMRECRCKLGQRSGGMGAG
jgi:hypothetical protein